jgi:hypothetical protein
VNTPGYAVGVTVSGAYVYLAEGGSGLQVIDVTNPASPQIVGCVDTPGNARSVAVSGTHAYVADESSGLQILPTQCDDPAGVGEDQPVASTMLLRAHPNPAPGQTPIHFETRNGGPVQVSVYDLAGRRVRGLFDGILSPGVHDLFWDRRNEDGRAVPAGSYLIRVSTAAGTMSGRFVIVR